MLIRSVGGHHPQLACFCLYTVAVSERSDGRPVVTKAALGKAKAGEHPSPVSVEFRVVVYDLILQLPFSNCEERGSDEVVRQLLPNRQRRIFYTDYMCVFLSALAPPDNEKREKTYSRSEQCAQLSACLGRSNLHHTVSIARRDHDINPPYGTSRPDTLSINLLLVIVKGR